MRTSDQDARIRDLLDALGIKFSVEQAEVFWDSSRVIVVSAGEGAGKSTIGGLRGVLMSLTSPSPPSLGWVMGKDFEDAYKELVGTEESDMSVVNIADALGVLDRKSSTISTHPDQPCRIHIVYSDLYGPPVDLWVQSVSGYDPRKVGRDQPDFILGAEVSRWEVELWRRAQTRLTRKYHRGAWGYFSGSPEDMRGWFPEVIELGMGPNEQGIKSYILPSYVNESIYPLRDQDPAYKLAVAGLPDYKVESRLLGRPHKPQDAVLPEFKSELHVFPHQRHPDYPVYIFIDPGTLVYAVLFVQLVGPEVRVLDELYIHQASQDDVITQTTLNPLWPYVSEAVLDIASRQHHSGMGSPLEAWHRETGLPVRTQYCKLNDTLDRLRSVMRINPITHRPYLSIHYKCKGLIAELGGGPSPVPGGGLWRIGPSGDPLSKNDHACKALGYGLINMFGTRQPLALREDEEDESRYSSYLAPARPARRSLQELLRV